MKKILSAILLISFLIGSGLLPAQENPDTQMDFIDKLRKKGLNDLALEYIEKLQKSPPAKLAPVLPLEAARTRVLLAQVKQPEERMKLLTQAEKELGQYLKTKEKTPEAPQLRLEIARTLTYQGQALLGQAFRVEEEKKEEKEEYAKKSREKFIESRKKFDGALKEMEDLLYKYTDKDANKEKAFKDQLAADLLAGKFDRAKTYIFQARSYINLDDTKDRLDQAKLYETAYDTLVKEVIQDETKANEEARWLAGAWAIDVARRADKGDDALKMYKLLMSLQAKDLPEVATAQRWAKFFYIQAIRDTQFQPPMGKSVAEHLVAECDQWLKQYPKHHNSIEGHGVRFELAHAYLSLAGKAGGKYADPKAKTLFDEAQKHFELVANSHSDFAEEASRVNIQIKLLRIGEATSIAALRDFEECYLKARYEMIRMGETSKAIRDFQQDPPPDKDKRDKELAELQKKQKGHLKNVIAAFNRALELTTPQTPPYKIDEVRYFLAYTYLATGDHYRAAVLAEYLTQKEPPGKHAPLAANYALQAYEAVLKRHNEPANQERLLNLASFILNERGNQWKEEPVLALANYSLALYHIRHKDFETSITHLEQLPKDFRAYIFAKCQLALLALNVSTEAQKQNQQQKADTYRLKALQALKDIPTLPEKSDPATIAMYFSTQLHQGNILYNDSIAYMREGKDDVATAKLKEMVKFTKDLLKQFDKFQDEIDGQTAEKLEGALNNLDKFARLGETRLAYSKGEYDQVLSKDYTGDVVAKLEQDAKGKDELALADFQVTGDLLGLALRAHVQKGNFKEAEKVLGLVQKLKNPSALDSSSSTTASMILQNLLADLSSQIKTLREDKKEEQLKKTIENFSKFFDVLVQNKAANLGYNDLVFLANCYASVDQHTKAADLYASLEMPTLNLPPGAKGEAKAKAEAEHKKAEQLWWFLQVRCGEQWRLAKEYDKAKEVLKKVLDDPKAPAKLQAQRELNLVHQEEENFREAIESWNRFLTNPGLLGQMNNPNAAPAVKQKAREIYFDAYYNYIYSWYMFSQKADKSKEAQYLATAANYIWKLDLDLQKKTAEAKANNQPPPTDRGWHFIGERVTELMDKAPKLRQEYEKQKKEYEKQKAAAK